MEARESEERGPSLSEDTGVAKGGHPRATSSGPSSGNPGAASAEHPTCDVCRSRKVRCVPLTGKDLAEAEREGLADRCRGCFKRKEECSYDYVHKKPGRPFGSSTKRKRESESLKSEDAAARGPDGGSSRSGAAADVAARPYGNHSPSPALPFSYHLSPRTTQTTGSSPYDAYHTHTTASGHNSTHSFSYGTPGDQAQPHGGHHGQLDIPDTDAQRAGGGGHAHGPATGTIFGSARSALGYGDGMMMTAGGSLGYGPGAGMGMGTSTDGGSGLFSGGFNGAVGSVGNTGGGYGFFGYGYGASVAERGGPGSTSSPFDIGPQLSPRTEALFAGGGSSGGAMSATTASLRPQTSSSDAPLMQQRYGPPGAGGTYEPRRNASTDSVDRDGQRQDSIGSAQAWASSRPLLPQTVSRGPTHPAPPTDTPHSSSLLHKEPRQPLPQPNINPIPPIESVASYSDVMFFVSLHMRYNHVLVPLVHKPSFAQDVLMRRDQKDEVFRGLLCSIVSYTICQTPFSFMSPQYTRAELEKILRRCQKTSRAVQLRWHMSPNLVLVASTQLDIKTSLAATQLEMASVLMSDARRMVYSLGLHRETPKEGLSFIELEICRRLFWEIYQNDKTNVMNGLTPISLNDFEGTPPLPLEVDDEYLTTTGHAPQPPSRASYMSGFVAGLRLFQVLGQCQLRQRLLHACPEAGTSKDVLYRWIEDAQHRVRSLLEALPEELLADIRIRPDDRHADRHNVDYAGNEPNSRMDAAVKHHAAAMSGAAGSGMGRGSGGGGGGGGADGHERETTFGIQQANIHITALCVEFALLDFKVHLRPEEDTKSERESMARKAHHVLSSIPIEYLASNGESMRGKVLRIVLDLLAMSSEPGIIGEGVWDWWNMYSSVQFFQIIPDVTASENPSRRTSPS